MKRWLGILGSMLALLPLGCIQQTNAVCGPPQSIDPIYGMVTMEECDGLGRGPATLIRIDPMRRNSELWVLENPTATPSTPTDGWWYGQWLNDPTLLARSQALVQINGFTFACEAFDWCYSNINKERPETRVFESTQQIGTRSSNVNHDWPLSFGQRTPTGRVSIELGTMDAPVYGNDYNVVGTNYILLLPGEVDDCTQLGWEFPEQGWPSEYAGTRREDVTGIGYKREGDVVTSIFMAYAKGVEVREMCQFLEGLGATHAVLMDGGGSAGMQLKHEGLGFGHVTGRNIPYRIGLVTLEDQNRVDNGGFEAPDLSSQSSGTPPGFHSYSGKAIRVHVLWEGAMFLYDRLIYNIHARHHDVETIPSHGAQIAAIRTRGPDTNHITQELTVPANRYCMLHFFHGYNNSHSPRCPLGSKLNVRTETCPAPGQPGTLLTTADYSSPPTIGPGASLNEEWLRLLTPDDEASGVSTCMRLSFTANKENVDTPGNCEVLLDDVSVSCVQ